MSKKINPTAIGLFMVTGLALGVLGLLLFSSVKLFARRLDLIAYFNGSLNGLNEGAPVKYRGVTIGYVKRLMVSFNQATNDYAMPVILELEEHLLGKRMGDAHLIFSEQAVTNRVQQGLRASLQAESLVTGVLYVEIRFNPDAPPAEFHQLKPIYPELPTEPTQIQQLLSNLAGLDLKRLENNVNTVLAKVDTLIGDLHMTDINQGLTNLLVSADRLVTSSEITNLLVTAHGALDQYRALGEKLANRVDPLADGLTNTLAEANRTLVQIRGAGENLRTLLAPDSPAREDLEQTLQQLAGAAHSISALSDYLKLHPNALITGRKVRETKP